MAPQENESGAEREAPRSGYHKPRLTTYGDAIELTESGGAMTIADGSGSYTMGKTA